MNGFRKFGMIVVAALMVTLAGTQPANAQIPGTLKTTRLYNGTESPVKYWIAAVNNAGQSQWVEQNLPPGGNLYHSVKAGETLRVYFDQGAGSGPVTQDLPTGGSYFYITATGYLALAGG